MFDSSKTKIDFDSFEEFKVLLTSDDYESVYFYVYDDVCFMLTDSIVFSFPYSSEFGKIMVL